MLSGTTCSCKCCMDKTKKGMFTVTLVNYRVITLCLSSAKSIRTSPMYESPQIVAYKSSCKHRSHRQPLNTSFTINDITVTNKTYTPKNWTKNPIFILVEIMRSAETEIVHNQPNYHIKPNIVLSSLLISHILAQTSETSQPLYTFSWAFPVKIEHTRTQAKSQFDGKNTRHSHIHHSQAIENLLFHYMS